MQYFLKEFSVYRHMDFFSIRWWHVFTWIVFVIFLYFFQPTLQLPEAVIFIFTVLLIGSIFYDIFGYLFFRGWRKKLPFELIGWEKLMTTKNFDNTWYWGDVEIILHFSPHSGFYSQAKTLWHSFIEKAQKKFYPPEITPSFPIDIRHEWQFINNTASGSINNNVAKEFYFFLIKELAPLQAELALTKVELILKSKELYRVESLYIPD